MNHFFWLRVRRSTTERDPRELSFSALSLPVFRPILLFVFVWPAWHETHGAIPEKAHTHTHTETQKTPVPVCFSFFFLQRKEHPGSHSEGGVGTAQQSVGGGSCLFSFILNHRPPANASMQKTSTTLQAVADPPPRPQEVAV